MSEQVGQLFVNQEAAENGYLRERERAEVAEQLLKELGERALAQLGVPKDDYVPAQIDRLANFIMEEVPGEPSQSEGAVDTAIRLLRRAYGQPPGEAQPSQEPPSV